LLVAEIDADGRLSLIFPETIDGSSNESISQMVGNWYPLHAHLAHSIAFDEAGRELIVAFASNESWVPLLAAAGLSGRREVVLGTETNPTATSFARSLAAALVQRPEWSRDAQEIRVE
jgi:hypothetical protein